MKAKIFFWHFSLALLIISSFGCNSSLSLSPSPAQMFNDGSSYYCYITIKNTSTSDYCELGIESPTPHLQMVNSTPTIKPNQLAPLESITIRYEVIHGQMIACQSGNPPCTFDNVRIKARWADFDEEYSVPVTWSSPPLQSDCWVSDNGTGNNNYYGELCDHPQHDNNGSTSGVRKYSKIEGIYNPNSFPIDICIENKPHIGICISPMNAIYGDCNTCWVTILPNSSYSYGSTVRGEYGGDNSQCSLSNDGSIAVHATQWVFTDVNNARWIPIKVEFTQ